MPLCRKANSRRLLSVMLGDISLDTPKPEDLLATKLMSSSAEKRTNSSILLLVSKLRVNPAAKIVALPSAEGDNARTARLLDPVDGFGRRPVTAARTIWLLVDILW